MNLTPLRLLIGVITPEDEQNFQEYITRVAEIEEQYNDRFIRDSEIQNLKKPKIADPVYKTG